MKLQPVRSAEQVTASNLRVHRLVHLESLKQNSGFVHAISQKNAEAVITGT